MKEKEKLMIEIIKTQTEDDVVLVKAIPAEEDVEEVVEDAAEEETIVTIEKCGMFQLWQKGPLF
jgi:hypothetical protein